MKAASSKKLVDKYQYTENDIKVYGEAQFIRAQHIIVKEYFTLKKINITTPKTFGKYLGMVNQMNLLKYFVGSKHFLKCHKMLKTSSNLYVVLDQIESNPSFEVYLQNNNKISLQAKKKLITDLLSILRETKSQEIILCQLDPKNIQVSNNNELKIISLENALQLNKNLSSLIFNNLTITEYTAPQLIEFIDQVNQANYPPTKELQFEFFEKRLNKVDIYSCGKILSKIFQDGSRLFQNDKHILQELLKRMTEDNPNMRPNIDEIQSILESVRLEDEPQKRKISKAQKLGLGHLKLLRPETSRSTTQMLTSRQYLTPGPQDLMRRSSKTKSEIGDSPLLARNYSLKRSAFMNAESQNSNEEVYRLIVLKIIKRRNLCKFLLEVSRLLFEVSFINHSSKIMLAFLLVKKSVLLICSLARYLSTGKGESQQFNIKDKFRREFSKTNDCFTLSVIINKQMDSARNMFANCFNLIVDNVPELQDISEFNFTNESKSQTVNSDVLISLVKKVITEILKKINLAHNPIPKTKRNSRQLSSTRKQSDQSSKYLTTSHNRSPRQLNKLDTSVRSARSVRSALSASSLGDISVEQYDNGIIRKFLSHDQLVLIYLMGLILDFNSYEKMFDKLIIDDEPEFEQQSLIKKINKMESKDLLQKLLQMIK